MQIVDSNDFNLRTAVCLYKKDNLEFALIPVFHVGSKEFYDEVSNELEKCNLIIFEGIGSKKFKAFSFAYRKFANRIRLAFQNDELDMKKFSERLIHADYMGDNFKEEWDKIPLIARFLFRISYPIGLILLSILESKRSFAKAFKNHQKYDNEFWFMKMGNKNSVSNFIMKKRNQLIKEKIDELVMLHKSDNLRIGVIYGAAHMKSVIEYLTKKHQFKLKDSWFLTVFWLSKVKFKFKREENPQG